VNVNKSKITGKRGTKNIAFNKPGRYRAQASKENKSEIISIRLSPEKKDSLLQYAIEDDRTFSSLISKILGNWLRDLRKQDEWR
jgi:hypothetical protein